jgi:hypothetical protein
MLIALITIGLVGVSAYVWCTRGFFSALLHLFCVFAAGAIAFGVWEPVSNLLLGAAPERGFGSFLVDQAFGLGLILPFAISLALIRLAVDKVLPSNAQCDTVSDYVGGGVCGFLSGIIVAGMVLISLSHLRVAPDFWGYAPVTYSTGVARGGMERNPSKFVPWADRITAGLYGRLSLTTMRTAEPLGRHRPDLVDAAGAARYTYEGKSRTGMKRDAATLAGWYVVGDLNQPQPFNQLTVDIRQPSPQRIADLRGENFERGALVGFIVQFNSKAREGTGQFVIGAGQVHLVCESMEDESYTTVFPIAVVSRVDDPTRRHYSRFRFDSDGFFIASVGGESDAVLGFEFPVPAGYQPLALYVKNIRYPVDADNFGREPVKFSNPIMRDAAIEAGQITAMTDIGINYNPDGTPVQAAAVQDNWRTEPYAVTPMLGFIIQKGTERSLRVVEEGRSGYAIEDGELKISLRAARSQGQVDRKLVINRFSLNADTVMVQVDATPRNRGEIGRLMTDADQRGAPALVDSNGTRFEAVGFLYKDNTMRWLRYTRGQPLRSMLDAANPVTLNSPPDRELKLLFVVSRGVQLREFRIGDSLIESIDITAESMR